MGNMAFMWDNRYAHFSTVLTPSSEALGLPVEYTQIPDRKSPWRSAISTAEPYIDINMQTTNASAIFLVNARAMPGGEIILEDRGTGSTPGSPTTLATITPDPFSETKVDVAYFPYGTFRHMRLRFTNPYSANTYAEIAHVGIGPVFEPDKSMVQLNRVKQDPSVVVYSVDGQASATERTQFATGALNLHWQDQDPDGGQNNFERLREMYRFMGRHHPFFLQLDKDLDFTCYMARFTSDFSFVDIEHAMKDMSLTWEEVR